MRRASQGLICFGLALNNLVRSDGQTAGWDFSSPLEDTAYNSPSDDNDYYYYKYSYDDTFFAAAFGNSDDDALHAADLEGDWKNTQGQDVDVNGGFVVFSSNGYELGEPVPVVSDSQTGEILLEMRPEWRLVQEDSKKGEYYVWENAETGETTLWTVDAPAPAPVAASTSVGCAPGRFYFAPPDAMHSCVSCQHGKYQPEVGFMGGTCTDCPPGRHAPEEDSAECAVCPAGTSADTSGSARCATCAPGKYTTGDVRTFCYFCEAGKYSQFEGATSMGTCTACTAGKYAALAASAECLECAEGASSPEGARFCTPNNGWGAEENEKEEGQEVANVALRHQASGAVGAALTCGMGEYYSAPAGSTPKCVACAVGKFQPRDGFTGSSCARCSAGHFADAERASTCQECPPGRSAANRGVAACAACTAGKWSTGPRSTKCEFCAPGKYGTLTGATSPDACSECRAGTFAELAASSECLNCGFGERSPKGAAECEPAWYNFWGGWGGGPAETDTPPPTPSPKYIQSDDVVVLQMEFELSLCGVRCGSFERDPTVIVNSAGFYSSAGERAVAFSLAALVEGVVPGENAKSTSFVKVPGANEAKRQEDREKAKALQKDGQLKEVCDTDLSVLLQVDFDKVGLYPEEGKPLETGNPKVDRFANQLGLDIDLVATNGRLQSALEELWFQVDSICEAPHDYEIRTHVVTKEHKLYLAHEYESCYEKFEKRGYAELDKQCKREVIAYDMLLFLGFFIVFICCLQIQEVCERYVRK
mmetsp:Transcript_45949/g.103787  ORF Transcript_45949/g.103787 Transcript_45949/m.103787 type:complete len:764 (+) Transcript_45949:174-2465(+)|eukprot:CAMPEP_0172607510 /NCGR_PEP_ID=MMETSP1068-20121228/27672_1 /TAXON_ID=35684 /ORGANISM="Pseudopedinella elastica, Strain CCMP716" /LENGTH=763 /DNA_ID=CAMNT_0013410537 /DNA_START=123 /DNA_END=2414 /DNA_ORIENTATION=-